MAARTLCGIRIENLVSRCKDEKQDCDAQGSAACQDGGVAALNVSTGALHLPLAPLS